MKVIIHDEVLITEGPTFDEYLIITLQLIKGVLLPFGVVWIVVSGDFLQLPPLMSKAAFQPPKYIGYNSLRGNLWVHYGLWDQLFRIYELKEKVKESSDPKFAQILKRIIEGIHINDDFWEIKSLSKIDTLHWSNGVLKVYLWAVIRSCAGSLDFLNIQTVLAHTN